MIKVCGYNKYYQLGEKSNNKSVYNDDIISPFVDSSLDVSSISSYSLFSYHSVAITKDGEALATGNNEGGQIIGSLPKEDIKKFTKFDIKDLDGHKLHPISAVCGNSYTLYMVSQSKGSNKRFLVYSHKEIKTSVPLFLNIGNFNPVSIYGGNDTAIAIDEEGSIIFIPNFILVKDSPRFNRIRLPNDDRAVSIACCIDFIVAVGFSGRVYESKIATLATELNFKLVESLKNEKISEVNGASFHCFAVTENGKVFGCGANSHGRLGVNQKTKRFSNFVELSSLNKYKITHAYAGDNHSLFQTEEGKILSCGYNGYNALLQNGPSNKEIYEPTESKITRGATFCIAGSSNSVVFIGHVPSKSPNMRITTEKVAPKTPKKGQKEGDNKIPKRSTDFRPKIKPVTTSPRPNIHTKSEEDYFISMDEESEFYSIPIKIGEGGTSITYKVFDKRTKTPVCKKVLKYKKDQTTIKDAQNALKEFEILWRINHPCICDAIAINIQEEIEVTNKDGEIVKITTIALFLEYLEITLNEALKNNINNTLKVRIALDVAHSMNFLHKHGMMHRDLKIENIMLNEFYETKLVDFGLIKINESAFDDFSYLENTLTKGVGTFSYMSPEMINEEDYDNKTDVYSFGVVLHAIFNGNLPEQNLKDKMAGKKVKLPEPSKSISSFCIQLIEKCLSYKPSNRPSFEDILNQIRKNSYELAPNVNTSILEKRDKELDLIEQSK